MFDLSYANQSEYTVVHIVANAIANDSRVLKTAESLSIAGFYVQIVGLGKLDSNGYTPGGVPFHLAGVRSPKKANLFKLEGNLESLTEKLTLIIERMGNLVIDLCKKSEKIVIHSHDFYGLGVAGFAIAFLRKINSDLQVYWIHDIHEWLQGSRIELSLKESLLSVEREFIKLPNQLTTVSAQIGENIQKYYGLMNRPTIVHNCPAFVGEYRAFPDIRSQIGLSAKAALGVYVGSIKPGRGLEDAIRATSSIAELNFALVGPFADSYREELRELVRFLSIENRVHFFGPVPHQYVSSFISSATFGFQGLPSYPNADLALPNKLFEYMHAKIPVVSSDLFLISDFLSSFSLGMVYQNKNLQSLSKAFIDICRSAEDFNTSFSKELLYEYSWETQFKQVSLFYSTFIKSQIEGKTLG